MPYRHLLFSKDNYYHLYNRGSRKEPIFTEKANYQYVLLLISFYCEKLSLTVIAYCLMPNHHHLLVRQEGEGAAGLLVQRVFNRYSKAYNLRYHQSGTLFEGRYKAIHIDKTNYLTQLSLYIHANPVKAGLVRNPGDWEFSNYLEWLGKRLNGLFDKQFIDEFFPDGFYAEVMREYIKSDMRNPKGLEKYMLG